MNRYILRFSKTGNMRFISHLDLQRLFQRAIKRGDVKVAYSHGYNPHELINIVQPLSLGYEGLEELFEIDTLIPYDCEDLKNRLNLALPEGISFFSCTETERKNQTTSCATKNAVYEVVFNEDISQIIHLSEFLAQDIINIQKKNKKTGQLVEKDIKSLINSVEMNGKTLILDLACAGNASLNPSNLLNSLFQFSGKEFSAENCRITRVKLYRNEQ